MTQAIDLRAVNAAIFNALNAIDRLQETSYRAQVDRALAPGIRKLQLRIGHLFERQGVRVARRLYTRRREFHEALADDFDALFDGAIESTSDQMQAAIENATADALLLGAKSIASQLDWARVFSLTNPRAVSYIRDNGAKAVANIDDTTRNDIRNIVLAGIENGTSYAEVARQIKARYAQYAAPAPQRHIRSRAELIAVTEMGNAYQAGNFLQARTIADAGVALEKKWQTVGDARVSAGCKANQAQDWIGIDKDFDSGDPHPLRFPGCRCVALYRRAK